jgi:hypothetical protein
MDFSTFIPREAHRAFQWLGRFQWLKTTVVNGEIKISFDFPAKDNSISLDDYNVVIKIRDTCISGSQINADLLLALYYRATSTSLANGPKMFRPTPIQCEAMENVDAEVFFEDYRQPYETLIVQLPEEYRRSAMERHGFTEFPIAVICHHDINSSVITVASTYSKRVEGESVVAALWPSRPQMNIEESLGKKELKTLAKVDAIIQRLGINICLLMTHYRTRTKPLDPERLAKLRSLAKKENKQKSDQAKSLLIGQMSVVEFEQSVSFFDVEDSEPPVGPNGEIQEVKQGSSGWTVRPHWRKGFYKRQIHGTPWLEKYTAGLIPHAVVLDETHHRTFIKPVLVKRDWFVGEKAQTSVVYSGDKRDMSRPGNKPRP